MRYFMYNCLSWARNSWYESLPYKIPQCYGNKGPAMVKSTIRNESSLCMSKDVINSSSIWSIGTSSGVLREGFLGLSPPPPPIPAKKKKIREKTRNKNTAFILNSQNLVWFNDEPPQRIPGYVTWNILNNCIYYLILLPRQEDIQAITFLFPWQPLISHDSHRWSASTSSRGTAGRWAPGQEIPDYKWLPIARPRELSVRFTRINQSQACFNGASESSWFSYQGVIFFFFVVNNKKESEHTEYIF